MRKKTDNYLGRNLNKKRTPNKLSITKRSHLMSKIRSRSTKFEKDFIELLYKEGITDFDTNVRLIRGTPDIVFNNKKICIFLDSDFWHGWYYPRWKHLLKNSFWREKIEKNRRRDKNTTNYLKRHHWIVLRYWEHDVNHQIEEIITEIKNTLDIS